MSRHSLRIAIVGGGISGLAAAACLIQRGFDVIVYEQAPALGEVGAGVFIYPNSLRQLHRLGLKTGMSAVGGKIGSGSEYYRMDGMLVGKVLTTDSSGWNGMYGMHRADLLQVLQSAVPDSVIRTSHRCVGIDQTESEVRLRFGNGEVAAADVVVAADGIHSALQKYVVAPSMPHYSGFRAYRGLLPMSRLPGWRAEAHQIWMGDGKHFMVFPVRGGEMVNYVGFVPTRDETVESWSAIGDRDELAASFAGWDPRVVTLLEQVETCNWWGLYDRAPLDTWTNGRLVLLGDAAHPMLPHLGQGANQSIEDGVALSVFLEECSSDDVAEVLTRYAAFRRERTNVVQAEARQNGLRYDSAYKSLEQRDREIANSAVFRRWLFDYDVEMAAHQHCDEGARAFTAA